LITGILAMLLGASAQAVAQEQPPRGAMRKPLRMPEPKVPDNFVPIPHLRIAVWSETLHYWRSLDIEAWLDVPDQLQAVMLSQEKQKLAYIVEDTFRDCKAELFEAPRAIFQVKKMIQDAFTAKYPGTVIREVLIRRFLLA
jgi:hypothetical protein